MLFALFANWLSRYSTSITQPNDFSKSTSQLHSYTMGNRIGMELGDEVIVKNKGVMTIKQKMPMSNDIPSFSVALSVCHILLLISVVRQWIFYRVIVYAIAKACCSPCSYNTPLTRTLLHIAKSARYCSIYIYLYLLNVRLETSCQQILKIWRNSVE